MRGNKFELIFYLKIPSANRADYKRSVYLPTTVIVLGISLASQCRHLFKRSLRCEDR